MMQQPAAAPTPSLQNHAVRTSDQHSPGQQNKLQDHNIESNHAFEKTNPPTPISNNLLIMANEHREFSISSSADSQSTIHNLIDESKNISKETVDEENTAKLEDNTDVSELATKTNSQQSKNANLTVATNIANAFINLATTKNTHVVPNKNLNVIVTQQHLSQHLMKTLSFTTSRGGIYVPNVIATNVTPQFTVHQYGLHGNSHGPAPNVTVNPNGNFNSNSNAIRHTGQGHFRLLFQQAPNINLNVINNNNQPQMNSVQPSNKSITTKTIIQNTSIPQNSQKPVSFQTQRSTDENVILVEQQNVQSISNSNDQPIRVLTPSEIMKTLPSLSSHEQGSFGSSNSANSQFNSNSNSSSSPNINESSMKSTSTANSPSNVAITSENNTLSSNFVTSTITKTTSTITNSTLSSNNAPMQTVRGYKTYKNINNLQFDHSEFSFSMFVPFVLQNQFIFDIRVRLI